MRIEQAFPLLKSILTSVKWGINEKI
jgi:hypothetical protein